jgi:hypothetical protein
MPHGKGKVPSLHFTSSEGFAEPVHFAGGVGVSRLQARAPVGRRAAWFAGLLEPLSRSLHQRAPHLAPRDVTIEADRSKLRAGMPGWLALTGSHNKAVETDAQVRPLPSVAPILGRRSLLR